MKKNKTEMSSAKTQQKTNKLLALLIKETDRKSLLVLTRASCYTNFIPTKTFIRKM